MGKILDYRCTYDSSAGLGQWTQQNPALHFPQAYCQAEMMAELAQTIARHENSAFCILPFCHTLEAEAYGADIRLGDGTVGPRAGKATLTSLEQLPPFNMELPRLQETLRAVQLLKEQGEKVLFQASGPLTILNSLYPSEKLFRMLLKDSNKVLELFLQIGQDSMELMKLAEAAGADLLSYADPMGGVNLLGPKLAAIIAEAFTHNFLQEAEQNLREETMLLLCPKTAFALIGTELAIWKEHPLDQPLSYGEAALQMKGKLRFGGQCCVKKKENCTVFRELILK